MPTPDLASLTTRELLATYVGVLDQLQQRGLIRTRNAPMGDLIEHLAWRVYGGTIEPNSMKSHDILDGQGRRIQVKGRAVDPAKPTQFSPFRSWDFDVAVFVVLDQRSYDLLWAREVPVAELRGLGRFAAHVNGTILTTRLVRGLGRDVSADFERAITALG